MKCYLFNFRSKSKILTDLSWNPPPPLNGPIPLSCDKNCLSMTPEFSLSSPHRTLGDNGLLTLVSTKEVMGISVILLSSRTGKTEADVKLKKLQKKALNISVRHFLIAD